MKIAIISDVHSNLEALQSVKKDIETQGIDEVHCLGDTLGYNANPLECLNIVLQMCKTVLKGNHEDSVCNLERCYDLNRLASEGVHFSRKKLTQGIIDGIDKFPCVKQLPDLDLVLCHGSFTEPSMWKYLDTPYKAKQELEKIPRRICLVGHTHTPFVFCSKKGLHKYIPDNLELDLEAKYIINVGSVGQPRDGDCRSSYAMLEFKDNTVIFNLRRVFYDISKTARAMFDAQISTELSERLYLGE